MVNSLLRRLVEACFPQLCLYCRMPSQQALPLCADCHADLPGNDRACSRCALPLPGQGKGTLCGRCLTLAPSWDSAIAPLLYDPQLALLVQRWKYRPAPELGELAVNLWLEGSPAHLPTVDIVVPVPLHWRRLWRRGFNQAQQLSEGIRQRHPSLRNTRRGTGFVRRNRHTPGQAGLNATQRIGNLQDAFTILRPCDNLRIALVDDVVTTGATAEALSRAFKGAGAREVHLWSLARTPAPPD